MADARQIEVWENYALQCRDRDLIPISKDNWFANKLASLKGIFTIIDIGCGPGNWANLFSNYRYIAFDQSPSMLHLVKSNCPKAEIRLGNAAELAISFPELWLPSTDKIDLCFTSAVLQHNRHTPDKANIVDGMYSILRSGGYYMCAENTFVDKPSDYTDGYSFTRRGWQSFMFDRGFQLIEYTQAFYEKAVPTSLYLYQKI